MTPSAPAKYDLSIGQTGVGAPEILQAPHPALRKKCSRAGDFGSELDDLIDRLYAALDGSSRAAYGIAAPQIGESVSVFVLDPEFSSFSVFVNPEILATKGKESVSTEACLSLPESVFVNVPRPRKVRLRYQDRNGVTYTQWMRGLMARVIQHEVDHLNGKLITDYRGG